MKSRATSFKQGMMIGESYMMGSPKAYPIDIVQFDKLEKAKIELEKKLNQAYTFFIQISKDIKDSSIDEVSSIKFVDI